MIKVHVKPNSLKSQVEYDENNGIYLVYVKSPADKNKANKELIKLLSKHFKKKVMIKSGLKSKIKYVELMG